MLEKNHVTVIGAGLAGALLGIYLARLGYKVDIFERRPDMRSVDISAGRSINLALANRGIHALSELGLLAKIKPFLIPMKGRMVHDQQGKQEFQAYGARASEVIYSISRASLNKLLMDEAEATGLVKIHFSCSLEQVNFPDNILTIKNADNELENHAFNRIIGTDGFASQLRQILLDTYSKENYPHQVANEALDHSYKELTIPPTQSGEFAIEPEALHIWPRGNYMTIALPNTDKSFTVTLFMPNEGVESFAEIDSNEKLMTLFSQQFPDIIPLAPDLQTDFFNNPTGRLSTIRTSPWFYQDKALILGDAAHAIVPFHGQGMNCAFEDCSALYHLMTKSDDWQWVFSELETIRRPNSDAIADMALENYIEMRDTVRDERFQLKKLVSFALEKRFPDVFIPRYSMVMFHRIPYAKAQQLGVLQEEILDALTASITAVEQLDYRLAQRLIEEKLGLGSMILANNL